MNNNLFINTLSASFWLATFAATYAQTPGCTHSFTITQAGSLTSSTTLPLSSPSDMNLCLTIVRNASDNTEISASVQAQSKSSKWNQLKSITLNPNPATPTSRTGVTTITKGSFDNSSAIAFFINGKPFLFFGEEATPNSSQRAVTATAISFKPNATFPLDKPAADCDKNCKARISYDFSCKQFRLFKPDGTPLKQGRQLHPRVGELLSINGINYNPLADSMDVGYGFFDMNMEGREAFGKLIAPTTSGSAPTGSTTPAKSGTDTTAPAQAAGGEEEKDTLATFENLAEALENYPMRQQALSLSPCQIRQDILTINRLAQEAGLGTTVIDWIATGKRLLKPDKQGVLAQITKAYQVIRNYKDLQLPPIQITNKDLTNLTFNFYRDGHKVGDSTPYSLANRGGFKLDFSTGIATTGLIDQAFTTTAATGTVVSGTATGGISTTAQDYIIKRDEGNYRIGLVLLAHAYVRTGWRVNLSITGGFMIDNNIATRYLIGGSLLLGREQRVILTWGKAFGKVKRLDDGLKEGQPYMYGTGAKTVPTRDVTDSAWFVGVTFNLGSL